LNHKKDPFASTPITFNVKNSKDPEFALWRQCYEGILKENGQSMWLVKPGGWSSQGNGIVVYDGIADIIKHVDTQEKTWVIQKYIEHPLLIRKRKFDIRAFCLVTQDPNGGHLEAFFYKDSYLRLANSEYNAKAFTFDRMVHITTDGNPKKNPDTGNLENKISMADFQKHLDDLTGREAVNAQEVILPQMKGLMADTIRAAAGNFNPRKIDHCFEIYGFDYMVDDAYRVWLLEVNANPSLELANPYLSEIIPKMVDEALNIALDKIYPQAAYGQQSQSPTRHSPVRSPQAAEAARIGSPLRPSTPRVSSRRGFNSSTCGEGNEVGFDSTDWISIFKGPACDEDTILEKFKWTWTEKGIGWLNSEGIRENCGNPKAEELVSRQARKLVEKQGDWEKCVENYYVDGDSQQFKYTDKGVAHFKREGMYSACGNPEPGMVVPAEARKYLEKTNNWHNSVAHHHVRTAIDPVNSPVAASLPDVAEDENGVVDIVKLGRNFLLPGNDAKMPRTQDIPSQIAKHFQKRWFVDEKRLDYEATEQRKRLEEEKRCTKQSRKAHVVKNFTRSPQCWNVYGTGHNGKLNLDGGCDGVNSTCTMCFEHNRDFFVGT